MGVRFKFNMLPSLLAGEKVPFFKSRIGILSGKSFPNYRFTFSLPPLLDAGLYVTDRRVLLVFHIFRLLTQKFSQWFEGKEAPGDYELVKTVSVGKGFLLGPYLEVVSENLIGLWYRSRRCRIRLYMREPECVCRIISEAMKNKNDLGNGSV